MKLVINAWKHSTRNRDSSFDLVNYHINFFVICSSDRNVCLGNLTCFTEIRNRDEQIWMQYSLSSETNMIFHNNESFANRPIFCLLVKSLPRIFTLILAKSANYFLTICETSHLLNFNRINYSRIIKICIYSS